LIDCFSDWVDDDGGLNAKRLNGAESDDPFYQERGYECKNGPLDTVDELLLIKGFTEAVVYGGKPEDEDLDPYTGIARYLTVWSDGRVNVNTASREVLLTLPGVDEWMVDEIIECRKGFDQEMGTRDDGCEDLGILPEDVQKKVCTDCAEYVRVVSIGEVGNVKSGIWAIMQVKNSELIPVFWREENMQ
jgi:general secretion pathway protein K